MKLSEEFNKKYAEYLEEDQIGMTFEIPAVLNYVDEVFTDLVQIPGFKYSQIYTKYGLAKVYTNLEILLPFAGRILSQELEDKINFVLKVEYEIQRRLKVIEDADIV
jgi:hypothetical protein